MTHLIMELVADATRFEVEDRVRRAELMRQVAGRGASESRGRQRLAGALRALASRLAPSPAASESPVSTIASSRATWS
jgi:hypothetical protein